ncbi:MAG TPA: polysaccharide pyruvyl transferase family protein [Acidimicrobiales bacterium]
MEPVLLVGAFGQGNPGDEALFEAFRSALDGWPLVVTSGPFTTRDVAARDVAARDTLGGGALEVRRVPSSSPASVALETARCGAVVFGGGTVFKTLHPSSRRPARDLVVRALLLAAGARAMGRPVAMMGVGVGDLGGVGTRSLARMLARQATLLLLRDERSAAALGAVGLPGPFRVGSDPAWAVFDTLPGPGPAALGDPGPAGPCERAEAVGLVLNHEMDVREDALVAALTPFVADGRRVLVIPWQTGPFGRGEQDTAERLARRLGGPALATAPPADLAAATKLLGECAVVLTQRFHALHAAAAAQVAAVAFDHEHKIGALAARLGQRTVAPAAAPAEVAAAAAEAMSSPPPPLPAVRAEIARAQDGFRLLRLLLDPSRLDDLAGLEGLPLEAAPSMS